MRLIAPVSRSAWLAMDEDARRALIAENVSAEHRARFEEGERLRAEQRAIAARNAEAKAERRVAEAERQARANDETATRRPAPHASAAPTRWLVSCAHGCGAMLPTSGPRPIVRWCSIGAAEHAVGSRA
ncbi:hypothetical protein [Amnibacterium sp.]|uniref:hypothetical protein n=1 Tax=Amnibacterium sp. TaxID=1872496 RepID=UPI003F7B3B9D